MFDRLTLLLAASCLLLSGMTVFLWQSELATEGNAGNSTDAQSVQVENEALPLETINRAAYEEMIERPLFVRERRPAEIPATETAQARSNARFALEGMAVTSLNRVALLRDTVTRQQHRVMMGASVEGWKVVEIEHNRVVMQLGAQVQQLLLRDPEGQQKQQKPDQAEAAKGLRTDGLKPGQWRR